MSLLNDNLINILYDAANNRLTENRSFIGLTDEYSYTFAINKNLSDINSLNNDFIESEDNNKIYQNVINSEKEKEIRV